MEKDLNPSWFLHVIFSPLRSHGFGYPPGWIRKHTMFYFCLIQQIEEGDEHVCVCMCTLSSPAGNRWQDNSAGVCCEHQLSSDSFRHQVLEGVQQNILGHVSRCMISVPLSWEPVSWTSCSPLSVHCVALFSLPGQPPTQQMLGSGVRECGTGRRGREAGWSWGTARRTRLLTLVSDGLGRGSNQGLTEGRVVKYAPGEAWRWKDISSQDAYTRAQIHHFLSQHP